MFIYYGLLLVRVVKPFLTGAVGVDPNLVGSFLIHMMEQAKTFRITYTISAVVNFGMQIEGEGGKSFGTLHEVANFKGIVRVVVINVEVKR